MEAALPLPDLLGLSSKLKINTINKNMLNFFILQWMSNNLHMQINGMPVPWILIWKESEALKYTQNQQCGILQLLWPFLITALLYFKVPLLQLTSLMNLSRLWGAHHVIGWPGGDGWILNLGLWPTLSFPSRGSNLSSSSDLSISSESPRPRDSSGEHCGIAHCGATVGLRLACYQEDERWEREGAWGISLSYLSQAKEETETLGQWVTCPQRYGDLMTGSKKYYSFFFF